MAYRFWDWLSCPACGEKDDVKMMGYRTEITLECYECEQMSEYTIGKDIPIHELDIEAIVNSVDDG